MKKIAYLLFCVMLIISFSSCSGKKSSPQDGENKSQGQDKKEEKIDKKEGQSVLEGYMRTLILRDKDKIGNFYSENLKQHSTSFTPLANPHPNGYKVDGLEEKDGKLEGKGTIFSVSTGEPYFSADESKFTVIRENETYVIDKIEKSKTTEVTEKDKALIMKEDGDVKGKEIVKLDDLPQYAAPQGATPDQKFAISREKFGPIAMDGEGKTLALSTTGSNDALMVLDIKKKQIKPLDIYSAGKVQSIAWSKDGKFLAVELQTSSKSNFIKVYDVEKEQLIDDPMKDMLKPDKYTMNTIYWISENELVFNVSGISKLTSDEQKKEGVYKFDAKNVNLTKF